MSTLIRKGEKWVQVAGGTRLWTGTRAQLEAALEAGEIPDHTQVMITDDYENREQEQRIQYGKEYWTGRYAPDGSDDKLYEMWLRTETNITLPQTDDVEIGELPADLGSVHAISGSVYCLYRPNNGDALQETYWPLSGYSPNALNNANGPDYQWHGTVFIRRGTDKCKVLFRLSSNEAINNDSASRVFRPRVRILYTRQGGN